DPALGTHGVDDERHPGLGREVAQLDPVSVELERPVSPQLVHDRHHIGLAVGPHGRQATDPLRAEKLSLEVPQVFTHQASAAPPAPNLSSSRKFSAFTYACTPASIALVDPPVPTTRRPSNTSWIIASAIASRPGVAATTEKFSTSGSSPVRRWMALNAASRGPSPCSRRIAGPVPSSMVTSAVAGSPVDDGIVTASR